jgi:hypothetical protein
VYLSPRHLLVFVVPILVVLAVFGFVAGKRQGRPAPREQGLLAHQANTVVEYPATWRRAAGTAPIPGVSIVHPLLLAPGGDAARAGLLTGQLPAGETGPLPARFVALMPQPPPTEVVSFVDVQAYRYGPLRLPAYRGTLELYAIPSSAGPPTELICYAAQGSSSYVHDCEQIVASLTLVEHSGYDLTPSPDYASRLSASITALDSERMRLRHQMSLRGTPAAIAGLATTLAARLTAAAASVQALQAPAVARAAQAALVAAIGRAHQSYGALAAAVEAEGSAGLPAAQKQVDSAEGGVDLSLETFALLGYKHS